MPKPPKRPRDPNQLAKFIVDSVTAGEASSTAPEKATVTKGRPGGLSGGRARAAKLSPERRVEIARAAAAKRWKDPAP